MEINHHETSPGVFEAINIPQKEDSVENLKIQICEARRFFLSFYSSQSEGIFWSKEIDMEGTYQLNKDSLILTTSLIRMKEDEGTQDGEDIHTDVTQNIVKVFSLPLKVVKGKRILGPSNIDIKTLF